AFAFFAHRADKNKTSLMTDFGGVQGGGGGQQRGDSGGIVGDAGAQQPRAFATDFNLRAGRKNCVYVSSDRIQWLRQILSGAEADDTALLVNGDAAEPDITEFFLQPGGALALAERRCGDRGEFHLPAAEIFFMAAKPVEGGKHAGELGNLRDLLPRKKNRAGFGFGRRHRGNLILQECFDCRIPPKKPNAPEIPGRPPTTFVAYGAAGLDPARIRCMTNRTIASPSRM